jgi:hypothetical protein
LAGLLAIIKALARAIRRDLRSYQSIGGNNFFLFAVLLLQQPASAEFFFVIFGFLMLFPLSSDPLAKIPPDRLALWPLSVRERLALRLLSIGLSPVTWIALAIFVAKRRFLTALFFLATAIAIQSVTVLASQAAKRSPQWNVLRRMPAFPGFLGGLIRNNIRQMLTVLDTYIALVLSLSGFGYRLFSRKPDPSAFPILALLVALALSTYAQCLFGLDGKSGSTRYRLLPLRGWQVLLAKDIAYLAILFVLVLPLGLLPGLTAGFAALAIGHHAAVRIPLPQKRWRFTGGTLFPAGVFQIFAGTALGIAAQRNGMLYFAVALACFVASLFGYGLLWDRLPSARPKHKWTTTMSN